MCEPDKAYCPDCGEEMYLDDTDEFLDGVCETWLCPNCYRPSVKDK
jgi:NAD-dependent SIR2 family protein deacetylase